MKESGRVCGVITRFSIFSCIDFWLITPQLSLISTTRRRTVHLTVNSPLKNLADLLTLFFNTVGWAARMACGRSVKTGSNSLQRFYFEHSVRRRVTPEKKRC